MTFTVHRNSLSCLQASQKDLLFPWRQISYTASNNLLLEGDTYLRSACGGSSNRESTDVVCKIRVLEPKFVELCPSPEISLIHSISQFGLLVIVPAFRDTFIFISNSVHRPSERLLRHFGMFARILERIRQMLKVF